jgi:hypothetical protein
MKELTMRLLTTLVFLASSFGSDRSSTKWLDAERDQEQDVLDRSQLRNGGFHDQTKA